MNFFRFSSFDIRHYIRGMAQDFTDATLVLLGHGTVLNEDSAAPVYQHAAELRRRKIFAAVREAFWKQDPRVEPVVSGLKTARAFIVPLMISEGHFSENVIPHALGFRKPGQWQWSRVMRRGEQTLFYCKAIGTHQRMTDVLLSRAREVIEEFPPSRAPKPEETTLIIAGHGTEKNEDSRKAIERQVEIVRELNLYADVHAVFLEEDPQVPAAYELARTRNMVIVPFFISDGLHTQEDIPVLLGEQEHMVRQRLQSGQPAWTNPTEKQGNLVWYARSVGTDPQVAEVILERVSEAAQSPEQDKLTPGC